MIVRIMRLLGVVPPVVPSSTRRSPRLTSLEGGESDARSRRARRSPPRLQRRAVVAAVALLVAALGFPLFERFATAAREHRAQQRLAAQMARLESQTGSVRAAPGGVHGSLDVPRLRVTGLKVVEGATLSDLRQGPGHVSSSQEPGQPGAVVILGHRSTYGAPFARLPSLRLGDAITLRTPSELYLYRVSVAPEVLHPGSGSVQLRSATAIGASRGSPSGADQALVLATGASTQAQSTSMVVVVASLDQTAATAAVSDAPSPTAGDVVAQFGIVPGESVGILLACLWLLVIAGAVEVGNLLPTSVPSKLIFSVQFVAVVVCVYQTYQAIDRIIAGTN